jgi:hypothetical protein
MWLAADYVVNESLAALEHDRLFVIPARKYKLFVALVTKFPAALRLAMEKRDPRPREDRDRRS